MDDGALRYFGEGQEGDMTMTAGNKAIAEHAVNGKDLLLFEALGGGRVRYRGTFNCADYSFEPGTDRQQTQRRAIVFRLIPANDAASDAQGAATIRTINQAELRQRAYAAAGPAREIIAGGAGAATYYARSATVRAYVLHRAEGKCEGCSQLAPFVTPAGAPY